MLPMAVAVWTSCCHHLGELDVAVLGYTIVGWTPIGGNSLRLELQHHLVF
jgi:hypothetical protein